MPTLDKVSAHLLALADRVVIMCDEQAEAHYADARAPEWIERDIADTDAFIREATRQGEFLSAVDAAQLREAKEERRELRQQREEIISEARNISYKWRELGETVTQQAKKVRRSPVDTERLLGLAKTMQPIGMHLAKSEAYQLSNCVEALLMYRLVAPTGKPQEVKLPEPQLPSVDPPEPAEVEFDDCAEQILEDLAHGRIGTRADYELNLAAQHLALMTGFEELLCLPLLGNIEHMPHQINTARQVLRTMRGRALLCDEVGLGKTIEAGLILKEYYLRGLVRKILILTPPSLVGQWQEQMSEKFGIEFTTHDSPTFRSAGSAAWQKHDRIIASLATARSGAQSEAVQAQKYDLVIVDEAHHLKNSNTSSWKLVNGLTSKYVLLLTATPVENNLDELFNLITLLSPGQLKTPAAFRREFVERNDRVSPRIALSFVSCSWM
jgi:hypothetical protein